MDLIADILLCASALIAAFYCLMLGRRLKTFNSLEKGVGGAVAALSGQVDDLTQTLHSTREAAQSSSKDLAALTTRSEDAARRLEVILAAMHDIETKRASKAAPPATQQTYPGIDRSHGYDDVDRVQFSSRRAAKVES